MSAGEQSGDPAPRASGPNPGWRIVAALVAGAGMALLFPPHDLGWMVWVVLLPLFPALWSPRTRGRGRRGFGLGFLAGLVFFLINLHWLTTVSPVGWVILAAYLALFFGLWGAFVARWANPWRPPPAPQGRIEARMRDRQGAPGAWGESLRSLSVAFSVAAVWCGLEWLRGWLFTGFGWNGLAVAFHRTPVMAQSADLLGVVGLSFLPVFVQAVIVQTARRMVGEARAGRLRPRIDFGVAMVLVALGFCYGVWRIHSEKSRGTMRLKALLVQLNIPQLAAKRLWSPEEIHFGYEEETLEALREIEEENSRRLREALEEGGEAEVDEPEWIVWPESALVGRLLRVDGAEGSGEADGSGGGGGGGEWATWTDNRVTIDRIFAEAPERTLVMGLLETEGEVRDGQYVEKEDARTWNSLVMFGPDGSAASFRKHHLVIFGEYIPLVEKLPFLQKIYEQQAGVGFGGAMSAGATLEPLEVEVAGGELGVIPTVCFEDTVPRLLRRMVRPGAQVILNVTNDGWFKQSPAAAQHFANARFRAIELRRPMLRCANTGVSAAVDTLGSTAHPDTGERQELRDADGSHFTRGWLLAELAIPKKPAWTLYGLIGDWGVIGLAVAGVVVGVVRGGRAS